MPNRRGGEASVTAYYNGACPICRAEIANYRAVARRRAAPLVWVDVARDPEALARRGGWRADPFRRLHVVDRDERLLAGIEAFRAIWRELPPLRPLAVIAGAPVVRPVAAALYDRVIAPWLWRRQRRRDRGTGGSGGGARTTGQDEGATRSA